MADETSRQVADKYMASLVLEHAFARIRYDDCAHEFLLAFSCNCRYFCRAATRNASPYAFRRRASSPAC